LKCDIQTLTGDVELYEGASAELQLMCIQWQRLLELANDHELSDSPAPAKLAFQFTRASASRWVSELTGVTMAQSRRQVQDSRRCFMLAWAWTVREKDSASRIEVPG
jgi:hypothetical protein